MLLELLNSSHLRQIGGDTFGQRMSIWSHTPEQLDAIAAMLQSPELLSKGVKAEKTSSSYGEYVKVTMPPRDASPHDVIKALLAAEMISQQDALATQKPVDDLMTKGAIVI